MSDFEPLFEPLGVFKYTNNTLSTGGVCVMTLAKKYGTPLYVYNIHDILDRYKCFCDALDMAKQAYDFHGNTMVHFAVKANSNQAILGTLGRAGCGMDIVSGGELQRVIRAGVCAQKIVFSGVAKTDAELEHALRCGVLQINVESECEVLQVQAVAKKCDIIAPIAVRINPNVDAQTQEKISTGQKTDKFGIDIDSALDVYKKTLAMSHIDAQGISVHIGSQLMDAEPFRESYTKVATLAETLLRRGLPLRRLDLGGGLGVVYEPNQDTPPDVQDYAHMVMQTVGHLGLDVHFEPGRWLVGQAGALIGTVQGIKHNDVKTFVLTDVGMNDLMRPTLYDAYHHIIPVVQTDKTFVADVVGPVCESGDYMAKSRTLGTVAQGDYIAILSTGAYAMSMSNTYNTRPIPAEVAVYNGTDTLIRPRQTIDDIIDMDTSVHFC